MDTLDQLIDKFFTDHHSSDHPMNEKMSDQMRIAAHEAGLTVIQGKVKDALHGDGKLCILYTDRLSAFDTPIGISEGRGQLLCELSCHWFRALTKECPHIPHHFINNPYPRVMTVYYTKPIRVEVIVRAAACGSMIRDIESNQLAPYTHDSDPDALKKLSLYDPLPHPIVHLTTKAAVGDHDQSGSVRSFIDQNILTHSQWQQMKSIALEVFHWGAKAYAKKGFTLADTKFEFGIHPQDPSKVMLIDEILTPDSSRIWTFNPPIPPLSWDKDALRNFLVSRDKAHLTAEDLKHITSVLVQLYIHVTKTMTNTL